MLTTFLAMFLAMHESQSKEGFNVVEALNRDAERLSGCRQTGPGHLERGCETERLAENLPCIPHEKGEGK
jgi:hypothetical protein